MKLSKKTLLYSLILALIMVLFIVGYFILMLPALYVSYVEDSNYEEIMEVHKNYMADGSYDKLSIKNAMNMATLEIPSGESSVNIINAYMNLNVIIKDEELREIIRDIKGRLGNLNDDTTAIKEEELKDYFTKIKDKLILENMLPEDYPVELELSFNKESEWKKQSAKVMSVSDNRLAVETSVTDGSNYYTAYFVIDNGKADALVISMLSVITPGMKEIRPIILQSLPMIVAVIFFLMLILSQIFSNKIVTPIIKLADYAGKLNLTQKDKMEPFDIDLADKNKEHRRKKRRKKRKKYEKDEIAKLGETLYQLYETLYSNYQLLGEKAQVLEEENKRQEVFLRASSHQLKTPIAAALLLVEGMMDEIGKYKNTKETLPKVKEQIMSMKKIVEEILYLNHSTDDVQTSEISVDLAVKDVLSAYQIQIQDRELVLQVEGKPFTVWTNMEILKKIIDNLMSNAVNHTTQKGLIKVMYENPYLIIWNQGDNIPDSLLPHVFEPFVSSDDRQKGKGLGLYVVSWYGKLLEIRVEIKNTTDGVQVSLEFPAKNLHKNFMENSYGFVNINAADERK